MSRVVATHTIILVLCLAMVTCAADYGHHVLLLGNYKESTQEKYLSAVTAFSHWCDSMGYIPKSISDLDYRLASYMVHMWYRGKSKVESSCTVYGLDMLIPGLRSRLPLALRSLSGYSRLKPSVPHPPIPWTVATAIAAWLASNHPKKGWSMAVGIVLSFDCYLRTGELLGLLYDDIAFGRDSRLGLEDDGRVHIHLRTTKTGAHKGVEVRDEQVKQLLMIHKRRHKPGDRMFPWHRSTHLKWFHKACVALRLPADYVHHSLRHGGATRDYLNGMPIGDVMVRGRWAATKSAVHYIQQGRQLMMLHTIPSLVDKIGRYATSGNLVSLLLALSQYT